MSDQVTRRAFLAAAGAAGAVWLAADPEMVQAAVAHARRQAALPPPHKFDALTPEQAADLEAVAMRIFPTDETPGAKEAGVIHFMDKSLSTYAADQKDMMVAGLDDLNGRVKAKWPTAARFSALTPAQQDEVLKDIEKSPFFEMMRVVTRRGDVREFIVRREPGPGGVEAHRLRVPRHLSATLRLLRRRSDEGGLTDADASPGYLPD